MNGERRSIGKSCSEQREPSSRDRVNSRSCSEMSPRGNALPPRRRARPVTNDYSCDGVVGETAASSSSPSSGAANCRTSCCGPSSNSASDAARSERSRARKSRSRDGGRDVIRVSGAMVSVFAMKAILVLGVVVSTLPHRPAASFEFPTEDSLEPAPKYFAESANGTTSAAEGHSPLLPGIEARHHTHFPGFPSRSRCVLPEGFIGVCLPGKHCAFVEYQLGVAYSSQDPDLWRHLRGFVCGFDRLAPKFCCPHPSEAFYDFPERPDERYLLSVFEGAEGGGDTAGAGDAQHRQVPGGKPPPSAVKPLAAAPRPTKGGSKPTIVVSVRPSGGRPSFHASQSPPPPPPPRAQAPPPPPPVPPPTKEECGQSGIAFRIVGGNGTSPGEWPWAAAIGRADAKNNGRMSWGCGGALITSRHVLTAAHCLPLATDGKRLLQSVLKQYVVRVGDSNILTENDEDQPQDFSVAKAYAHPDYQKRPSFWNDIAILKLKGEAELSDVVSPICVPLERKSGESLARESVIAIGWGSNGKSSTVDNLQTVSLPVVPLSRCRERYKSFSIPLRDTQMCAGIEGRDTCKGDSGAPVMVFSGARAAFEIVGITSIGSTACGGGLPGVYTKVDEYIDWIRETVSDER